MSFVVNLELSFDAFIHIFFISQKIQKIQKTSFFSKILIWIVL
jgi:hypothetical protein